MTIENFNNILLGPVAADDYRARIVTNDEYKLVYYNFRAIYEDWPFVTKTQRDCFELYYNLNMTQKKISQFLNIKQSTVSEHIRKARNNYIELVKIIYYCTLWGIDYGVKNKN